MKGPMLNIDQNNLDQRRRIWLNTVPAFDTLYDQMERGFFLYCSGRRPHSSRSSGQSRRPYTSQNGAWPSTNRVRFTSVQTLILPLPVFLFPPKDDPSKVAAFISRTADTFRRWPDGTPPYPPRSLTHTKSQEEQFLGSTFNFERVQDDDQAYKVHVHECFYHPFSLKWRP